MLDQIKQILEDLFDIPIHMIEESDHLRNDWGIDHKERAVFEAEFCAEFNVRQVPPGVETVAQYMRLIDG